jgi:hypothetical protein
MTNRTRKWRKNWIRNHDLKLDLAMAIEDERLNFATTRVIGRWFDRLDGILSSVNPRLMFNYDKTMLAANLSRGKVGFALDQRVFRQKHEKPHHCTLSAVFNTLGRGRAALGDAEGSTVPASDLVLDKLGRATPFGSFYAHEGNVLERGPPCRRGK